MKKVFTVVAVAMVSVAVLSSCNSPKSLAKKAAKALKDGDDKALAEIEKKVEKLSEKEQEEFAAEFASIVAKEVTKELL